ncbi:unnamed protein product [Cyclocybe aegerita]|uniref:Uncharacterized protein n=1 Tax=Cyclocybe aegerita TaxID=1973307 RepID=A0A8S0W565_CYCAE|nr:unnamed protein product [Cyclocybe aegerita]
MARKPNGATPNNGQAKRPGAQATRFKLGQEHIKHINSYMPQFKQQVYALDPQLKGNFFADIQGCIPTESAAQSDLTSLTTDSLDDCDDGGAKPKAETYTAWVQAIMRRFTNYFTHHIVNKEGRHSGSGNGASPEVEQKLDTMIQSATAIFMGDFSPRELFARENEDAIKSKMQELSVEFPALMGGGLRNKAVAALWATADQDLWKAKAKELLADVNMNREHFPLLMARFLKTLCSRGCVGTVYTSFSYAVRSTDDGIKALTVYAGFDSTKKALLALKPNNHEAQADAWVSSADSVLPRKFHAPTLEPLPLNNDGLPLLPCVDSKSATPSQLIKLLTAYLNAVWAFSWSAKLGTVPPIPWKKVALKPQDYYDTTKYPFPVSLKDPKSYETMPGNVYILFGFLSALSPPFMFQLHQEPSNISVQTQSSTLSPTPPKVAPSTSSDPQIPLQVASSPETSITLSEHAEAMTVTIGPGDPFHAIQNLIAEVPEVGSAALTPGLSVAPQATLPAPSVAPKSTCPGRPPKDKKNKDPSPSDRSSGRRSLYAREKPTEAVNSAKVDSSSKRALDSARCETGGRKKRKKHIGWAYIDEQGNEVDEEIALAA